MTAVHSHIVTLVASQEAGPLTAQDVARAMAYAEGRNLVWLDEGHAAEFQSPTAPDRCALAAVMTHKEVDIFLTRPRGRRKAVLVADMDSTIVTAETLDELAAFAGLKEKIAYITARAMNGELDFQAALRERVRLLKGLKVSALEDTWKEIQYTPGARALVATMNEFGATTALVSGGFTFFTARVAQELGFTIHRANTLLDDGTALTGEVGEPILDRHTKLASLEEFAAQRGVKLSATLSVGDGANDLPMLKAAGLGIAYHAKPVVAAEVVNRVTHTDLTSLLFAQGYPASSFKGVDA
ncbi:phosphoserine phosphatase SerB [Acidocella aminolytica]|jgi:phosphoserine phosphatase|uniref:Phosphoserine phosphatase n=1 Tax=Acidocella aminolytica 101 = DSM 11237 TaxID=1120923 RepID=A0A0D6PI60_9PROT|nr:phosphoserine phosphatase SerB [Acidocella aminolytica]GAN80514.1 phosphoserine phosphatase [Acidocella aminolytica 101 = DSM 11237]